MSDLASTISMLAERGLEERPGRVHVLSARRVEHAGLATAEPKPYQPGSMARDCAQENTQGMARRPSMLRVAWREAGGCRC